MCVCLCSGMCVASSCASLKKVCDLYTQFGSDALLLLLLFSFVGVFMGIFNILC